jgi:hypothetical protein
MFTACSSGLRSFRGMAADLESMYYKCPIFKPSFKSFCCENERESREQIRQAA